LEGVLRIPCQFLATKLILAPDHEAILISQNLLKHLQAFVALWTTPARLGKELEIGHLIFEFLAFVLTISFVCAVGMVYFRAHNNNVGPSP
jgi:hypothetical protein